MPFGKITNCNLFRNGSINFLGVTGKKKEKKTSWVFYDLIVNCLHNGTRASSSRIATRGGLMYRDLLEVLVLLLSPRIRQLYGQMAAIFFRF